MAFDALGMVIDTIGRAEAPFRHDLKVIVADFDSVAAGSTILDHLANQLLLFPQIILQHATTRLMTCSPERTRTSRTQPGCCLHHGARNLR